jgi:hypothetical protein
LRKMTDKEAMAMALEALEGVLDDAPKVLDASISGGLYEVVQCRDAITALKERLAQPEPIQSLQCFHCQVTIETLNDKVMHLLEQRTWVGLTDEEIDYIYVEYAGDGGPTSICEQFAKAYEAKLKEKNT